MKVIFHPDARAEFHHDIRYYAEQRHGLGIQFRILLPRPILRPDRAYYRYLSNGG